MRVFLDTNIIIDLLDNSREGFMSAALVFEAAKEGFLDVCLSSQSITDCSYIARKKPLAVFQAAIGRILPFVDILPLTKDNLFKAASSDCPDFEDAALIACAEKNLCDIFLTSNTKHIKPFTTLPVQSPKEFVQLVKG